MKDLNNQPHIKIGDTVWWVHCSNKTYKGIAEEYSFCESQGAVYLYLLSPTFKLNLHPCVHYSHCFKTSKEAKEFAKYLKKENTICKRCDRCEFNEFNKNQKHTNMDNSESFSGFM